MNAYKSFSSAMKTSPRSGHHAASFRDESLHQQQTRKTREVAEQNKWHQRWLQEENNHEVPECGAHSKVLETREPKRRRECYNGHRFSSIEVLLIKGESVECMVMEGQNRLREAELAKRQAMANAPGRIEDVARAYGVSTSTVYKWRTRFAALGAKHD